MYSRRDYLLSCLAAALSGTSAAAQSRANTRLVNVVRTTNNPWLSWWDRGGRAFARSLELSRNYVLCEAEGTPDQILKTVASIAEGYEGDTIINFNSGNPSEAKMIIDFCFEKKIYLTTHFNKPSNMHPWQKDPYWVAHISNDDKRFGVDTANTLIKSLGSAGNIVALNGNILDLSAARRFHGLQEVVAQFRAVNLIDYQDARWSSASAYDVMRWMLARFGTRINGVWAANDAMALGAIEALRVQGVVGKIAVTGMDAEKEALLAMKNGDLTASLVYDPYWCGSIGLAIAYAAKIGNLVVPDLYPEQRELTGVSRLVTKDNLLRFTEYQNEGRNVIYDWAKPFDSKNFAEAV